MVVVVLVAEDVGNHLVKKRKTTSWERVYLYDSLYSVYYCLSVFSSLTKGGGAGGGRPGGHHGESRDENNPCRSLFVRNIQVGHSHCRVSTKALLLILV